MKKLLFLLMLLPLWTSCKKEDDDTQLNNKKKTCLPTTINLAEYLTTFEFDDNGRLIKEFYRDHNGKPTTFNYEYTNDKLSKITEVDFSGGQIEYSVSTDNSGRITEVANQDRTLIYAFIYDKDSRVIDFSITTNGKIDQQNKYSYQGSTVTAGDLIWEVDSNPNPLRNSIHYFVFQFAHFQNNILLATIKNPDGTMGDKWIYQYSYNSSGYPTSGKVTFPSGGFTDYTFDYTCK